MAKPPTEEANRRRETRERPTRTFVRMEARHVAVAQIGTRDAEQRSPRHVRSPVHM